MDARGFEVSRVDNKRIRRWDQSETKMARQRESRERRSRAKARARASNYSHTTEGEINAE
jgi:hypothetical protein